MNLSAAYLAGSDLLDAFGPRAGSLSRLPGGKRSLRRDQGIPIDLSAAYPAGRKHDEKSEGQRNLSAAYPAGSFRPETCS